ncbi:glycosyltransferase family 39 protein [candidate division KSB1 bacterium]|nr:glycosyltransferase family 39 protein [candidate division KSB1 bacterium]
MRVSVQHRAALYVILIYGAVCAIWSQQLPEGEAPDEAAHVRYAEFLYSNARLPTQSEIVRDSLSEGFQSPLYHIALACVIGVTGYSNHRMCWAFPIGDGAQSAWPERIYDHRAMAAKAEPTDLLRYRMLRLPNVIFGMVLLWIVFRTMVIAGFYPVGSLLVSLLATTPAMLFSGATISNDMLAGVFCAAAILGLLRYRSEGRSAPLWISACMLALGMMTKSNVVFFWSAMVGVLFLTPPRWRVTKERLVLLIVPLLLAGWSMYRAFRVHPRRLDADLIAYHSSSWGRELLSWVKTALKTVYNALPTGVGVLGAQSVWLPGWYYGLYFGLTAVLLILAWRAGGRAGIQSQLGWSGLLAAVALSLLSVHWFRESGESMHSRLFIPYLPAILLLLAARVAPLPTMTVPARRERPLLILAALLLVAAHASRDVWFGFATAVKSTLHLQRGADWYAAMIGLWLAALGSASLMVATSNRWWPAVARRAVRSPYVSVWIAVCGATLSTAMFWIRVLPRVRG